MSRKEQCFGHVPSITGTRTRVLTTATELIDTLVRKIPVVRRADPWTYKRLNPDTTGTSGTLSLVYVRIPFYCTLRIHLLFRTPRVKSPPYFCFTEDLCDAPGSGATLVLYYRSRVRAPDETLGAPARGRSPYARVSGWPHPPDLLSCLGSQETFRRQDHHFIPRKDFDSFRMEGDSFFTGGSLPRKRGCSL